MRQTPEAEAFLKRIIALPKGPGISLNEALQPSLDDEADLRKLFATDKANTRLDDPLVGLVDVFDAPADIRTTRARVAKDDQDLARKYVMPLSEVNRRAENSPSMVNDLEEFQKNWSIFTEGSLSQLFDWNNVVAAGGAVLACLTPLSAATKESKRSIRKYYHSVAYPTSDVDLFLWGMNAEQAEKKIITIYEAVRDSVPWDVTCVRTRHTVSIHSQYPYRSVQIVLRLYSSPAEILAGFDVDAPSCLYNGQRVLANPRAIVAMMRQANTVDMTRRSPSYEVRLAKYSSRGFEVYVPTLERDHIDPTIYERSIARIEGLARLLVLEKLTDTDTRYNFLESRRNLRGRPNPLHRYYKRKSKYKGDLKADTSIGGLEMNDYDVATLHIPYGPGWNARRIDKLVYQTDLGMNSTFNPKNKGRRLHRHPAFFGTMEECLEDCCEHCPEPIDSDERGLQEEEDKNHIRGRIAFIEEDPGRQSMSGSFNPIDVGEWSAQVYIGETEHFFAAIVAQDREAISKMIKNELDVNRRDHVGRTALHLAIVTGAADIACDLIEAGARMTARLVDGRSALHLAAQFDQPTIIRKLFERSAVNKASAEAAGDIKPEEKMDVDAPAAERPSSEDDWTSGDDGVIAMDSDMDDDGGDEAGNEAEDDNDEGDDDDAEDNDEDDDDDDNDDDDDDGSKRRRRAEKADHVDEESKEAQEFPEDSTDQPDVLEINLPDWDLGFTPLAHAVISGSLTSIDELLKEGADATLLNTARDTAFHPLTLTILREDEDEACKILERLISAGASTSTADDHMRTIFHRAVVEDKIKLVSTILKCDPNADTVLNFPAFNWNAVIFPVVSAIERRHYSMLATLLAYGAKIVFSSDDVARALEATPLKKRQGFFAYGINNAINEVFLPLETALAKHDDVAQLLIAVDAEFNIGLRQSLGVNTQPVGRRSILDWVRFAIAFLSKKIASTYDPLPSSSPPEAEGDPTVTGWKKYLADLIRESNRTSKEMLAQQARNDPDEKLRKYQDAHSYLVDMERVLVSRGAKSWNEIYMDKPSTAEVEDVTQNNYRNNNNNEASSAPYCLLDKYWRTSFLSQHLTPMYDELYEACFAGDDKKIEQLCLPQEETKDMAPLNIFVQVADSTNAWSRTGYTPLFAAVSGRQWATAKLVMAIAVAQYCPPGKEDKFSTRDVDLYDDSDDGSEDSEDSDATAEQTEITFVDIAKRASAIETDVHPSKMLDTANIFWRTKDHDGKYQQTHGNLLLKAIHDNDIEMFINMANLYDADPLPIPIQQQYFEAILEKDRSDLLDVYIRKTGQGIEVQHGHADQEVIARNDKDRLYLGLNVHGKKRADLAKMSDPNAMMEFTFHPLVWKAAASGANAIIEYLAGDRPLAAYRHYASTGGDERAYQLRRVPDLEKVLPLWLGWTITNLGDSPLMAAILGGNFDAVKTLFAKKPKLMSSCLHECIKFSGYNALLLVADTKYPSTTNFVDYLLAKSVSPAVNDSIRGWNIYHILCENNNCDAIEHLLKKLPRNVNEALLTQQSKGRFNTPLHIAVKEGASRAVKLILNFTTSSLLMRDIDGSTVLHCAVQRGFGEITETILKSAPSEALYMENGVGETPLDMATLKRKLETTNNFTQNNNVQASALNVGHADENPKRIELSGLREEIERLQSTIEGLVQDGRLVKGTKLAEELSRFAGMMEEKVLAETAAENVPLPGPVVQRVGFGPQDDNNPREWYVNPKRTLDAVAAAVAAAPGKRLLVHLVDVQKSVQGNLAISGKDRAAVDVHDDGDGLGQEEDAETKENSRSLVLSRLSVSPDTY